MVLDKKRGLSPIIATILLIALAMVLASIIFLWARGWIFEQIEKKGAPIDQICKDVKIEVDPEQKVGNEISVWIANRGSVYISAVEIRQEGGGSSSINSWNLGIPPGASGNVTIRLEEEISRLIIYPQLVGSVRGKNEHKTTTCLDSGKTIKL